MEKAKDYFDREYDGNHIATVVDMFDLKSLYGLTEEYAEAQVKKLSIHNVSKSIAKQYAEFCVRCDREELPLLELDDYIKQYCC